MNFPNINKMKRYCILIILGLIFFNSFAQTQADNLKKYWFYRDRIRKSFVSVGPDVEELGYNLPTCDYFKHENKLSWADNNAAMPHYLGMLATEMWLLKNTINNFDMIIHSRTTYALTNAGILR